MRQSYAQKPLNPSAQSLPETVMYKLAAHAQFPNMLFQLCFWPIATLNALELWYRNATILIDMYANFDSGARADLISIWCVHGAW